MDENEATTPEVANQARIAYLTQHGAQVPIEQMYVTSLMEYLILANRGPEGLAEARGYHEARIAPILDNAVANMTAVEDRARSAHARATLLNGVSFRA